MSRVRTLFLGTPEFALTQLKSLFLDPHFEIVAVVTQPDRPKGRDLKVTSCPVKLWAQSQGITCLTPLKINDPQSLSELSLLTAELAIVVAYGQILSQKFIDQFQFGAVNLHASLLPKWRGAAPIQRSLEAGDSVTGVVLQKIVKELDAGDALGQRQIEVPEDWDAIKLHDELAQKGSELLSIELMDYVRGNLVPQPQDSNGVTYASKIQKTETQIDWTSSALAIHNKVRAFLLGPGCWTVFEQKRIKIIKTQRALNFNTMDISIKSEMGLNDEFNKNAFAKEDTLKEAGLIVAKQKNVYVLTGQGWLELITVQPEGKNKMSAWDWYSNGRLNEKSFAKFVSL